jgi:hypothetical protein
MNNPLLGIDATNAGLFSAAAYHPIGTLEVSLEGWLEDQDASQATQDRIDQVRVFANSSAQEVVLAFKGSDNFHNFKADLLDSGASEYAEFHDEIIDAYIMAQAEYAGYHFFVDGHSLGGGLAQNFALEAHLDGFGQNALPATNGTDNTIAAYRSSNTFIETNVAGDVATLYYSTLGHGPYLDDTATELPSIYPAIERLGMAVGIGTSGFGMVAAAWAFGRAHSIQTVNELSAPYSLALDGHLDVPVESNTLPESDAIWFLDVAAQIQSVTANGDGTILVQDWVQQQWGITAATSGTVDVQDAVLSITSEDGRHESATVNVTLTNADPTRPNYNVSWSHASWGYTEDNGAYIYNADGLFDGHWYSSDGRSTAFSFDPTEGAIHGDGANLPSLASYAQFNYYSDGTFQGAFGYDTVTGSFKFGPDGKATWEHSIQGYYPRTDIWTAYIDGSYTEEYSDRYDSWKYVQYADGSSDYIYA